MGTTETGGRTKLKLEWKDLADYAEFLLNEHLDEFLDVSFNLISDLKVPLIEHLTAADARALSNKSALELLISLTHQNPGDHVRKAIERWRNTQFPKVTKNKMVVDDVTRIAYSRKIAFLKFLPAYTKDIQKLIAVVGDIERYLLEYTATTFDAFVGIIDERINEHVQKLEERTRELQESNASLEEYAYVTSHDLKEPLRKISMFLDRLEPLRQRASEKEKDYLNKIQGSALRMTEMIDDLLSLSLIAQDRHIEKTDLEALLQEVLLNFEPQIEELHGTVSSGGLPEAAIVRAQFRQLFQNLISNSLKFSDPNRRPVINISHRFITPDQVVDPALAPGLEYLEIRFSDNGIGFDSKFEEKIFAVFQRLHLRETYEGNGIGLAICRKIAKNHGGTIKAEGVQGSGATFTILIPSIPRTQRKEQDSTIILP